MFSSEVYVLVFKGQIFAKRVSRFRCWKQYKNINISSIKCFIITSFPHGFKRKYWSILDLEEAQSSIIYLKVELVVKCKKNDYLVAKFSVPQKRLLAIPTTKV